MREELHPHHYATPNVFSSSCLRPSTSAPAFLLSFPPYIPPLVASPSHFPLSLPRASLPLCVSALWMLQRAPLAALLSSIIRHARRFPCCLLQNFLSGCEVLHPISCRSAAFFRVRLIAYTPPYLHAVTREENGLICEMLRCI